MCAVELVQADGRLVIQTDVTNHHLLGVRMSLVVKMGSHYLFGAEVVASHYPLSECEVAGSAS